MPKATGPNMTFLQNFVFTYMVTFFLFVKIIFFSVPPIHYELMKLNFAMSSAFPFRSW